jgi:hypothetical protein
MVKGIVVTVGIIGPAVDSGRIAASGFVFGE